MAKDTEKLIRQLSLISYLMAERRPVTATEIRRDVEGYSGMNEDAFARRVLRRPGRARLARHRALGRQARRRRRRAGELLAAPGEVLPARHPVLGLRARRAADRALAPDGEFAYAEPLRLALQQISWGPPNPLGAPDQHSVALGLTASAGGHELSQRLAKVETAIFRRKTITFEYHSLARDEVSQRKVDPYSLLFQGGQFYLVGKAHERDALRVFRLSRIRGKVAYASKAEHDFQRPEDFDPRAYATRSDWQLGDAVGTAEVEVDSRVAWHIERHFGRYGEVTPGARDGSIVFATPYADARLLVAWVLGLGDHARLLGPPELAREARDRVELIVARHTGELALARKRRGASVNGGGPEPPASGNGRRESGAIRPERFARLVTLASVLIAAGRAGERLQVADVIDQLQLTEQELREDVNVLNVVNFGGRLLRALRRGPRQRRDRGRPRALLGQLRPPRPAAPGAGQGARGRHRPDRRPHPGGLAGLLPREDRPRPRRRPGHRGTPGRRGRRRRHRDRRDRLAGDRPPAGCSRSSTGRRPRTSSRRAWSSRTAS
jgi:proteasome accessory factor C